ncbi:hypothetical protein KYK29_19110 [Shinella daejeonensis]|uniref:hypothetical protein n=1 Tax=Shinella daejeonensis TaxID=659017 RepID=UPI0020C7CCF8|nr:hypothetical protein [Shinella daejeonensis]MCP8897042.1 hypothetical protein [Shinella daejeonensis]
MAEIVQIREWMARQTRRETFSPVFGPAEVLFFTGVRYERQTPGVIASRLKARKKQAAEIELPSHNN